MANVAKRDATLENRLPLFSPVAKRWHLGNVQDRDGAKSLLEEISAEDNVIKRLKLIWTDGGYRGELISWVEETLGWKLEIVEKPKDKIGFKFFLNVGS